MNYWIFINIDTLGMMENAAILSMGLLKIDFDILCNPKIKDFDYHALYNAGINIKFDLQEQILTRVLDKATLNYWNSQTNTKILEGKDRIPLKDGYKIICDYASDFKPSDGRVVSRGFCDQKWWINFVEHTLMKKDNIFPHWCWSDLRTISDLLSMDSNIKSTHTDNYTSLHDCVCDAMHLQKVIRNFLR